MPDNLTEEPEIPVNARSGGFAKVLAELLNGGLSIEERAGQALQKALTQFAKLTMRRGTNASRFDITFKARLPENGFPENIPLTLFISGGDPTIGSGVTKLREELDRAFPDIEPIVYAIERQDDGKFLDFELDEAGNIVREDKVEIGVEGSAEIPVEAGAVTLPQLQDTPKDKEPCDCVGCTALRVTDQAIAALQQSQIKDISQPQDLERIQNEAIAALQAFKVKVSENKGGASNKLEEILAGLGLK